MRSSFDGNITEIPFILVDNFENDLSKNAYFLSHYHGDHVIGLDNWRLQRVLKRHNAFIYASKVTIAIIEEVYPSLKPYLKILELGRNTLLIKTDEGEVFLNVTTLPAGHSLGSTMFLFEHNKKKFLYTGDFRITPNNVSKFNHFHCSGEPIHLDALYVDTTFQNVPSFPQRSEVVRNTVLHVKNWLDLSDKHRVHLATSANYGYEYVCNEIYNEIGVKTYVGEPHWRIYSQFPKEIYGITNDQSSRIHLTTKYRKRDKNPLELYVLFSAMKWGDKDNIDEEYLFIEDGRIEVCFSTHCGRNELVYFINYFKPKKIVGFPNPYDPENVLKDVLSMKPALEIKISSKKRKIEKEGVERVGKRVDKSVIRDALDW